MKTTRKSRSSRKSQLRLDHLENREVFALDPTFGVGGVVTADFSGFVPDRAWDVAIQSDGKIVAVGGASGVGGSDFAITRYNADGSPDLSFGVDGRVMTDFADKWDRANAVAIQSDGKIVAAGFTGMTFDADVALARYNADGSLDSTFGVDGRVTTNSGFVDLIVPMIGGTPDLDAAFGVAIQSDGKIVIAGVAEALTLYGVHSDFLLARYNTDGMLDGGFGWDEPRDIPGSPPLGVVTTNFGGLGALVVATVPDLSPTGEPLGTYHTLETTTFSKILYGTELPEGYALNDIARSVAIGADGTITVAGGTQKFAEPFSAYAVARYASDGTLFEQMVADLGPGLDESRGLALLDDGGMAIAGGVSRAMTGPEVGVVRYNSAGYPMTSFNGDGVAINAFSSTGDVANAIIQQPDGKLVIAGATGFTGFGIDEVGLDVGAPPRFLGGNLLLARYTGDGMLDSSFDGDGLSTIDLGDVSEQISAAVLQSDGKLVAAGVIDNTDAGTFEDFLLIRDSLKSVETPNDPPVAGDDTASTDDRTAITIPVLANDSDPDGDMLSITSVSTPSSGTAVISGGSIVYTPKMNFGGKATFDYTISDGHGGTDTATVTVTVKDVTGPQVVEVSVSGSKWKIPAYSIPVGTGEQLRSLPWIHSNKLQIRFSENVTASAAALALKGVAIKSYKVYSFTYDPTTFTATWTLRATVNKDKLLIDLSDAIVDGFGNHLDGEWTNPMPDGSGGSSFPSGDGMGSGRFRFRFNVLPGDYDQNGVVNKADGLAVRDLLKVGGYNVIADVDSDGLLTAIDLKLINGRVGAKLPPGEPMP